ncbi:MAG: Spy/CpxP family protein refolding chaperone [Alsobacter sp.]
MTRKVLILSGLAAILAVGGAGLAYAERGHGPMGGPGMMGPGMMGPRFCAADEPFAPRILDRMERRIQPTDAQKPEFDALKAAAAKAEQQLKAACPTDAERADMTPPGRLNLAEKRMSAGLEALRTIKGPFDALYAKLDDKQRDRMRWAGRGWGERGGHGRGWDDGR